MSLNNLSYVHNDYVGKQPVAWKEYWSTCKKELQESMKTCIGCHDITELYHPYN